MTRGKATKGIGSRGTVVLNKPRKAGGSHTKERGNVHNGHKHNLESASKGDWRLKTLRKGTSRKGTQKERL